MSGVDSIDKYSQMMRWLTRPKSQVQEPRNMDLAALSDDVVPGRLKDELAGNFDPKQETYEEYLQRINLERPFNMAEGGQLVAPSVDGSRPGYSGEFGPNIRKSRSGNSFEVQVIRGGKKFYDTFTWGEYKSGAKPANLFKTKTKALKAAKAFRDEPTVLPKETGTWKGPRPWLEGPKETGKKADIRKVLQGFMDEDKLSFTTDEVRQKLPEDVFPNDKDFTKALDSVKKEKTFKSLKFKPRLQSEYMKERQGEWLFDENIRNTIKKNYGKIKKENLAKLVFPDVPSTASMTRLSDILSDMADKGEIKRMKRGQFSQERIEEFDPSPEAEKKAKVGKRRRKTIDILGSKDYEKELRIFKKNIQEGLGLGKIETSGRISGKSFLFDPIDMGHQSSIKQLKALKQKLRPEDLGPQFYRANREGIRKYAGGVKTLENKLNRDFYPEQKKLYNKAKKFIAAGKKVPADLQNKIINSNEKIQIFIDDTVKKYPLLKDKVNAITLDADNLTVKRGGNVLTELGVGLVDQDLGNIKLNSLDDLTIKANLAEQTLKEAVDAGLIDEKVGRQRLNKFLNVRPGEAGFISRELLEGAAKGAGRALNLGFGPMGAAGLTYAFKPEGGYDLRRPEDRITFEAEAALAPTLVKGAQSVTEKIKNPLLRKGFEYASGIRLPGVNPANMLRAARVASPVGLLSLAGEGIYHARKKEMERRAKLSPQELADFHLKRQSRGWSGMDNEGIASLKKKW
jgi:hypothetical protein